MVEWQVVRLSDIITVKHGYAFKGEYFVDFSTTDILITPGNFSIGGGFNLNKPKFYRGPVPNDYVLMPGDVIVTMTDLSKEADTLGYSAIVPYTVERLLHNQRVGKISAKNDLANLKFISWLLRTPSYRNQIVGSATGSTVKHTSPERILSYEFKLPAYAEQQAIASILGSLDDKIELNRRMNETLEAMAQAIFQDWFVAFGPVRRKQAGVEDPSAILGGLLPDPARAADLAALFPDRLADDGLPVGWEIQTLGQHVLNYDSKRVPVSSAVRAKRRGPFPYHGATGVMDFIDSCLFDDIFVLVGEDGSVVRDNGLAFTQYVWGKFWVNNHAHVLQGKYPVSTEQLLLYFGNEIVTPFITGAVQLKLSQGRMNAMPFVYSGDEICRVF